MPFAVIYVPLLLAASPRREADCYTIQRVFHYLAVCVLSPPSILLVLSWGWSPTSFEGEDKFNARLMADGMWRLLSQYEFSGTAILPFLCFVVTPLHMIVAWLNTQIIKM